MLVSISIISIIQCLNFHPIYSAFTRPDFKPSTKTISTTEPTVIATEEPDYHLDCYQCTPTRPTIQVCDDYHWHTLTPADKQEIIAGCPPDISSYCVKKETFDGRELKTYRGCIGDFDSAGNKLKVGCIVLEKLNGTDTICFCSESLCNAANIKFVSASVIVFLTLILYFI